MDRKSQDERAEALIAEKRRRGSAGDPSATQPGLTQPDLTEAGRPPDTLDPRAKSSGKGKKTADKWNQ
jgi:hypothetical protein